MGGHAPEAEFDGSWAQRLSMSEAEYAAPDELVFLDDIPVNIDAACQFGIHGLLHRSTPGSIEAINDLITP